MKSAKTNVIRLLDEANISYTPYEYDETIVDGEGVALALKEDPECVFKSLVCEMISMNISSSRFLLMET